jgi:tripartite-type tricarboxylate transporter receptor subunit TctC
MFALTVLLPALPALAQQPWTPSRPLRIIIGFPPGSSNDVMARFVGAGLTDKLGQQAVIDNRPGAAGNIGAELVSRAAPDGHTLLVFSGSHIIGSPLYRSLPYHPVKSFSPISMLGVGPMVLVVHPKSPANSVKELIEMAKVKPQALSYSSAGLGSINHYAGELLGRAIGAQLLHVPHKGGAPAFIAVMGGEVNIMFATLPLSLTQIRAGRVKALAVTAVKRSPLIPNIPTIAEGGVADFEVRNWWGVMGPAGLRASIVTRYNSEITQMLTQPESAKRLAAEGAEPWPTTPEEQGRILSAELEKWTRVAREAGIKAE